MPSSKEQMLEEQLISVFQFEQISESPNCRGWKGPLEIVESNPPATVGFLQQLTQVRIQTGLESSPEKEVPQPLYLACSSAPPL